MCNLEVGQTGYGEPVRVAVRSVGAEVSQVGANDPARPNVVGGRGDAEGCVRPSQGKGLRSLVQQGLCRGR